MEECLRTKPCKCSGTMQQVISMLEGPPTRTGWFCPTCRAWDKAIGRERIVTTDHLGKGKV